MTQPIRRGAEWLLCLCELNGDLWSHRVLGNTGVITCQVITVPRKSQTSERLDLIVEGHKPQSGWLWTCPNRIQRKKPDLSVNQLPYTTKLNIYKWKWLICVLFHCFSFLFSLPPFLSLSFLPLNFLFL